MVDVSAIRDFLTKARSAARVLIVDDEPATCSALSMALEESGLTSVTTETAEEAYALLESETFALLVSDKNLPGMSGLSLLVRARAVAPEMPVVMMTGYASIATVKQAISVGAIDYIAKPFADIFVVARKLAGIVNTRLHIATYERTAAALLAEIRIDGFDSELSNLIGAKLGVLKKLLADSPDVLVFDEEDAAEEIAASFESAGLDTVRASSAAQVLQLLDENPTLSVAVLAADHRGSERLLQALKSERYLRIVLSSSDPKLKTTLSGLSKGAVDLYARDHEDPGTLAVRLKHRIAAAQREQLYTRLFSVLHAHSDLVGEDLVKLIEELAPAAISEQVDVPHSSRQRSDTMIDERRPDERMPDKRGAMIKPGDTAEFLKELSRRD